MNRKMLALVVLAFAACSTDVQPKVAREALVGLAPATSCDDVLAQVKAKTESDMDKALDQNLATALQMVKNGCSYWGYAEGDATAGAPASGTNGGGARADDGSAKASDYSTTNNQVAGVDEADFVKNDGKYIYIVAQNKFQIIDAWPAAKAHRIAQVAVEGTPKRLFVHKDRALIYSQLGSVTSTSTDPYGYGRYYGGSGEDCTYGYDCDFTGDGKIMKVTVLDITDVLNPQVVRETTYSGSYLNSRRIGDVVHTMVVFPEVSVPGMEYWPTELKDIWSQCNKNGNKMPFDELEVRLMFAQLRNKNRATIQASTIAQYMPGIKDVRYIGGMKVEGEGLLQSCDNFFISGSADGRNFLSLVSQRIDDLGPISATTIVTRPGAVYASDKNIYVAVRHYDSQMQNGWYYDASDNIHEATTVHQFAVSDGSVQTQYMGSGAIKGRVLNQFAMDENGGYLRIATTTGHLPSPDAYSTVATMKNLGGALAVAGMVDNIAPSEDIRSVRFAGDVGFVVTFKKTDPLFVIDLSRPDRPVIKGELKIPGFSTYMHLMDDGHLLSIGYDADDKGSFAWFQGVMLQIFDVSDYSNPTLLHKEVIGTRGSTSEAATNHLAFNYFPTRKALAIPMTICEGGSGGGSYGDLMTFSGLLVYRVTLEDGFEKLGGLAHQMPETDQNHWSACSNWWTQSNSIVQRSIFMENFVYSIAMDRILIADTAQVSIPIGGVDLTK